MHLAFSILGLFIIYIYIFIISYFFPISKYLATLCLPGVCWRLGFLQSFSQNSSYFWEHLFFLTKSWPDWSQTKSHFPLPVLWKSLKSSGAFFLIGRGTWNWTKFNLAVEMDFLYSQWKFGQFIELWIKTKPAAVHMCLPEASQRLQALFSSELMSMGHAPGLGVGLL